MAIELWDHQTEALAKLKDAAKRGKKRIVLQAPPGGGKTEVAVEVVKGARGKHNSVGYTVPFLTLVDQTVRRFIDRGIAEAEIGVMQADHERTNETAPVQVATVQTLERRSPPFANVVIVDECHIRYDVISEWMRAYPDMLFVGMSATPWAKGMAEQWDELIVVETIKGLIDKGVLSPFRTFCPPMRPNLQGIRTERGDYMESELSRRMQERRLIADVVATWLDKAGQRPTLAFAVDVAHGKVLTQEFRDMGVNAVFMDAAYGRDTRSELIRDLESGALKVIVSVGTMTTGVDIPCVQCVSYVRPTKSPILFVQSMARGLRIFPGKTDCLFLDHSTTTQRLGLITEIGFDHLLSGVKPDNSIEKAKPTLTARECEACHYMVPPKEPFCPNCGAGVKMRTAIRCEDGELIEVDPFTHEQQETAKAAKKDNRAWTADEKRRFLAELKGFAEAMGYKAGWVAHKYRAKFAVWPNHFKIDALEPVWPPSPATASWIRSEQIRYAHSANRN